MGSVTVKWERRVYNEAWHEFIRNLAAFLPMMLTEYECAAMLGMMVELGDDDYKSMNEFEQFCSNDAARDWLAEAMQEVTERALAKWENGDFKKGAEQ